MAQAHQNNKFYKFHFQKFTIALIVSIILMLILASVVLYQITHRPLPSFYAVNTKGQQMTLRPYAEPNQLPPTLIRFASKAAVSGYTYDFSNFNKQLAIVRPYFTEDGWAAYRAGIEGLLQTVQQNKIFVNSVVSGQPVIASQGYEFGVGYQWQLQLPFLVTYQSSERSTQKAYLIQLTIVKVPTQISPKGIGIDKFFMGPYAG